VYVVEEYDTLLGIAINFDTTTEAIAAANGINENDFLQIGQELIIPADGTAASGDGQPATENQTIVSASPTGVETQGNSAPVVANSITTENATEITQAAAPALEPPPNIKINRPANINPLTGLPVSDPSVLQRRPLLVRIGNDTGVRTSQAGLNSADMVYEEITEWWVTRFTAIYLSETPNTVAPVRSARLINVQLVPQYQGALAHSGGSDPVRWEISQAPLVNLDEFYNPAPYYYRPNEGWQTRLAIDTVAARNYMQAKGVEALVSLHGFLFSDTIESGQPVDNIYIPYPRATTFTQWRYDPGSGKYLRFAADAPLYDANGLGQVAASNVIIYFAEHQETDIVEDANGATSIRIIVNGKGPAWFFRDGKLNKGFWQTDGTRTPYFGFEDGSPYPLRPGNTWVEVTPTYFIIGLDDPTAASSRP
jgi:LysM repeat protein